MKDEIYHILNALGYKVLPQYILSETCDKTLANWLAFAKYDAKRKHRYDLLKGDRSNG